MIKSGEQLSFFESVTMTAGFAIGAGVITFTGIAIGMTGTSVVFTFATSAFLFLVAMIPLIIVSSVLPRQSASYSYSKELIGEEIGGLYVYIYFLGRITIAVFGISFAQYLTSIMPSLPLKACAVGITVIFFLVNLFGIKAAAKIQNVMVVILFFALICFVAYGLPHVKLEFFSKEVILLNGWSGFYSACSMLFFAVGGSVILTDFGHRVKNAQKNIPLIIVMVTVIVAIIYTGLGVVAAGVLPVNEVAFKPLTYVAQQIFPNRALYIFFVAGGAMGALITTLNSSFVWYTNALTLACKEKWLPSGLVKNNRFGVPYRMLTLFMVIGILPPLLEINIEILSKIAVGLTIFSFIIPQAAILKIDKVYPKEWKKSKFRRITKKQRIAMLAVSYLIMSTQVYSLFIENPPVANIILLVYLAMVTIYLLYRRKIRLNKKLISLQK